MRLWHYKLIPVLPDKMLVSQWRECIAIKRQWENGSLNNRLVDYVKKHDKKLFVSYVFDVVAEMAERRIKFQKKYYDEIFEFCGGITKVTYPEHNERYYNQCYYNLQEKYDRGIINSWDWNIINKGGNKWQN